jgi:hypothetical protein
MNNKFTSGKNLSDVINNFNFCNNEFISNGTKNSQESLELHISRSMESSPEQIDRTGNRDDPKSVEEKFLKHMKDLRKLTAKHNLEIIKKYNLEEKIREKSFKLFNTENEIRNLPEYEEYIYQTRNIEKKIKFGFSLTVFYAIYLLVNVYEGKVKAYDNVNDLINNKVSSRLNKINFKYHLMFAVPLSVFLYYYINKNRKLHNNFEKYIRNKYFDSEFDMDSLHIMQYKL